LIGGNDQLDEYDMTIPNSPVSDHATNNTTGSRTFSSFTNRVRSNSSASTLATAYDNSSILSQPPTQSSHYQQQRPPLLQSLTSPTLTTISSTERPFPQSSPTSPTSPD